MRRHEEVEQVDDATFLTLVQEELSAAVTAATNYTELARNRTDPRTDVEIHRYLDEVSLSVARLSTLARDVRARCRENRADQAELAADDPTVAA